MSGFSPAPILGQPRFRDMANGEIAEQVGVKINTVRNWRHGSRLYPATADRVALRLGLHPVNLWPEWELT